MSGQKNYGFKYINTTNTTTYWGSFKWKINITDNDEAMYLDEVFNVAKKNNAYSYVRLPSDNKIYTIEEYMKMF